MVWENDTTQQAKVYYFGGAGGAVFQSWTWLSNSGWAGWQIIVPHLGHITQSSPAPTVIQTFLPGSVPPGTQQIFTFSFSDTRGVANIQVVKASLATNIATLPACTVTYQSGSFYLASNNDGRDGFLGPVAPNSGTMSNSSCIAVNPSVAAAGVQLTLTLPLTFSTSFPSIENVYEYVADYNGLNSGWVFGGVWDPPPGPHGNCATLAYGGIGGNPNDTGAYVSYASGVERINGNEVHLYSYTGVYGPNAALILTHATKYDHLNGSNYNTYTADSSVYGGTVQGNTWPLLYFNGIYALGTYQEGSPTGLHNDHWGTSPVCNAAGYFPVVLHYFDSSQPYIAVKPTIVGPNNVSSLSLWYLGGAPSIDGFYTQTTLYGNKNWNGQGNFNWSVIQRSDKLSLSSSVGNQVVATSMGANASQKFGIYDYDVLVQGNTDGLPTDPFPISIDAPWSLGAIFEYDVPSKVSPGWESRYIYHLYDVARFLVEVPITIHETIEKCVPNPPFENTSWCQLNPLTGLRSTWYPPSAVVPPGFKNGEAEDPDGGWTDTYTMYGIGNLPPPENPSGQTVPATNYTQKWFVGAWGSADTSVNIFAGFCAGIDEVQFYTDHGIRENETSPVAIFISGIPSLCAPNTVVN